MDSVKLAFSKLHLIRQVLVVLVEKTEGEGVRVDSDKQDSSKLNLTRL